MVSLAPNVMPSSSVTSVTLRVTDTAPFSSWPRHASRLHAPGSPWPDRTDIQPVSASGQIPLEVFFGGKRPPAGHRPCGESPGESSPSARSQRSCVHSGRSRWTSLHMLDSGTPR